MNKIYVYVEGGNVQTVRANNDKGIHIVMFDVDNMKEDGAEYDAEWNKIVKETKEIY